MKETFEALSAAAIGKKTTLEQNKLGYLFITGLGGMFVGVGVIILLTVGGESCLGRLDGKLRVKGQNYERRGT